LATNVAVDENAIGLRLDYRINEKHTMYPRHFRDQGTTSQPEGVTGRRSYYRTSPQNAIIFLQGALTQRLKNEIKFGYNGATDNRLMKTNFYIGYAQDEWRLKSNLTLSYGLRPTWLPGSILRNVTCSTT
jgi:hypothetical protein